MQNSYNILQYNRFWRFKGPFIPAAALVLVSGGLFPGKGWHAFQCSSPAVRSPSPNSFEWLAVRFVASAGVCVALAAILSCSATQNRDWKTGTKAFSVNEPIELDGLSDYRCLQGVFLQLKDTQNSWVNLALMMWPLWCVYLSVDVRV